MMNNEVCSSRSFIVHRSSFIDMNKSDLILEASKRGLISRRAASRGVEATLEIIKRELSADHVIQIRGLGSLEMKPNRSGVLPQRELGSAPRPIPPGRAVK